MNVHIMTSQILSERRKQLLPRQILRADEFVSALARCEPIYKYVNIANQFASDAIVKPQMIASLIFRRKCEDFVLRTSFVI